jgi:hypothetical protein
MITTTLNHIRGHLPCASGWAKLLRHLGKTEADDEPLPYSVILDSNGLDDALWCCRAEPQHSREWRLFAVRCARRVQHLMTDPRSIAALDVAERHASGTVTDASLDAAWDAASAAAWAAASDAAWAAAWAAAWDAAWAAASDAARAAASDADSDAASDAAWAAAWAEITADFRRAVNGDAAIDAARGAA